jgi:hypothetical protein
MPRETKSQRVSRQMKKDAERQQRRREKMAQDRRPDTHAVDRALSEALAYVVVTKHKPGAKRRTIEVPFRDVLVTASQILAHRGRFDMEQSMRAVVARTSSKRSHWRLGEPRRPAA